MSSGAASSWGDYPARPAEERRAVPARGGLAARTGRASITTDGVAYEIDSVEALLKATTVSSLIVAELRSGSPLSGPGSFIESFSLAIGPLNTFLPDNPVFLSPNNTCFFSLGHPMGNATLTDWFMSETDLTADGPAMIEQASDRQASG